MASWHDAGFVSSHPHVCPVPGSDHNHCHYYPISPHHASTSYKLALSAFQLQAGSEASIVYQSLAGLACEHSIGAVAYCEPLDELAFTAISRNHTN